jgi:hypothetical protein
VTEAATAFGRTSYDELIRGADPDELSRAEVYAWDPADTGGAFEWARDFYDDLAAFFAAAAEGGDAMLIWIN